MGLSLTVSELNGDFSGNRKIFTHPCIMPLAEWVSLWNWVPALGVKKTRMMGYRAEKEVWRCLQPSGYNSPYVTDGRKERTDRGTDGETDTGRQQKPRLRGGAKYKGWENFAVFDWNRCLSRKRCEIGPWLLWSVNRKTYALYRMKTFSMTLTDP